ncbi:PINIT domain-containing protein [Thamnidium elegans]|nr:PINIT domain-containing protein [Thamnidium elegans]
MSTLPLLQADLKKATVKELVDCIKAINKKINPYQKITLSGRKDEVVQRLVTFIDSLLEQNREETLVTLVRIVNENAHKKLSWNYENGDIVVNFVKPKRAVSSNIENVEFVRNPFLKPMKRLTAIKICPVAGQSRQSRTFSFTLTEEDRKLLATNNTVDDRPPYQIRFYCARYAGRTDKLEVEFPNICELKVNDNVIPGQNIRCLKGKPGTVNPPDLSVMSKKTAQNNLELIYINSSFPFIASVYIVERTPVQHLIDILKKERILSKEEVLRRLQEVQEDADIIMESETLSTKCPLAFTRIVTPIRSKSCNHLQCFDASTFLTMNEQTPTWSCPVCYRPIKSWEDLIVDEYFAQMLLNTPRHIDSVRVEPSGVVTIIDENPDLARQEEEDDEEEEETDIPHVKTEPEVTILLDDDDDDDEDAQVSYGSPYHATDTINIPIAVAPTPFEKPGPSCLRKSPPTLAADAEAPPPRKRVKKKSADVIDLTLDSDEDST